METAALLATVRAVPELARAHDQVAEHYRREIREGRLVPDQKLPTNRDMAAEWNISTHTVWRAMRILRDEGWIDYRQGKQPMVIGVPKAEQ